MEQRIIGEEVGSQQNKPLNKSILPLFYKRKSW